MRRVDALFEIERTINGQSAERRKAVRQSVPPGLFAEGERSACHSLVKPDMSGWLTGWSCSDGFTRIGLPELELVFDG